MARQLTFSFVYPNLCTILGRVLFCMNCLSKEGKHTCCLLWHVYFICNCFVYIEWRKLTYLVLTCRITEGNNQSNEH